jgi:hypothetical protein
MLGEGVRYKFVRGAGAWGMPVVRGFLMEGKVAGCQGFVGMPVVKGFHPVDAFDDRLIRKLYSRFAVCRGSG